jgi:PAS domain S-box-containing protein
VSPDGAPPLLRLPVASFFEATVMVRAGKSEQAAWLRGRIAQLQHILDAVPVFIAYVDTGQHYRFVNQAYSVRFNRPAGEIEGKHVRDVVGEQSYAVMAPYVERALAGEPLAYQRRLDNGSGEPRWVEARYIPDRDQAGRVVGFVALITDITERQKAAAERERLLAREQAALAEARTALAVRDRFLSIAAHELRTPLTTIKGYVQYLGRKLQQPDQERDRLVGYVEQLHRQIGRFERLVADLLDVARLQQGRLELRSEPVDLADLARQALARCEHLPERLPQHVLVLDAPSPVQGAWDPARLEQVLINLLSNALKYSPAGGEVRIVVRRQGQQAELAVHDAGVGMTAAEQAALFRPFARGEGVRQRISGLGLGLFISKQIIEQHQGTLTVESEPGRGSTVTLRLPVAAAPAVLPPLA